MKIVGIMTFFLAALFAIAASATKTEAIDAQSSERKAAWNRRHSLLEAAYRMALAIGIALTVLGQK